MENVNVINRSSKARAARTPGFGCQILPDTQLGIATLVAEDEEGRYEVVNYASTVAEGFEIAQHDLKLRLARLDADEDPGLCPFVYKLWAQGVDRMALAASWNADEVGK